MNTLWTNTEIPEEVRENVRAHRMNWDARFREGDNLRIQTPILEYVQSKQTREHLASMAPERRAQLQREWDEAAGSCGEPISAELRARADAEWAALAALETINAR